MRCRTVLEGHSGPVHVVRFDRNGEYCMSGGQDRKIHLWNPWMQKKETYDSHLIQTYSGHSWEIHGIAIAHDAKTFVSCGGDRQALLWDTSVGRIVRRFYGHQLKINAVAFNDTESSVLATGSDDRTVRLWDCRSSSRFPIQILEDAKDSVSSISIKAAVIAVASLDGHCRIYDLRKGSMHADNLNEAVTSVSLGQDSQCYLVSVADSTVRLIDFPTGKTLKSFSGHTQRLYRTESTFSQDESKVISGSEDSKIYVWDLLSGSLNEQLTGHTGPITSLSQSSLNESLLSASADGTIRLWV